MLNNRQKIFDDNLKKLFNTPNGKEVLAELKVRYLDTSALSSTPELTYYHLGQKELVQSLVASLETPEELLEIIVKNTKADYYGGTYNV